MLGITERGDAGLDLSWTGKLSSVAGAILITKNPRPAFRDAVLSASRPVIVHVTCTGYGGTVLEPGVPRPADVLAMVKDLVSMGFPVERLVLRVDPVIPTEKGIAQALSVIRLFSGLGIRRLRYSFLDLYPHVRERFRKAGLPVPWDGFHAPAAMRARAREALRQAWPGDLESCAESNEDALGCISERDYRLLGLPVPQHAGRSGQRAACLCLGTKTELLASRTRCPHGCLYCYWKDSR